jgi:hypothetical protein
MQTKQHDLWTVSYAFGHRKRFMEQMTSEQVQWQVPKTCAGKNREFF